MNRLLVWISLVVALSPAQLALAAGKPNIIHIMVDDAGLGDFTSFWSGSPVQTPNLTQLAAGGMKFTQAYSGGANCAPSRSALMTGRHLGHAYLRDNTGGVSIRDADVTIAEVLKQAGYATGGYGKWGLGVPGSPGAPERQGFDEFVGYYEQTHAHSRFTDRIYDSGVPLIIPENDGFIEPETGLVDDSRVNAHSIIYDRMKSFVRTNAESQTPFYAWGAWTPPHRKSTINQSEASPGGLYNLYANKPGWNDFSKIQAANVSWIDQQLGDLKQVLADPNGDGNTSDSVLNNTLIVFSSDNGGWQGGQAWDRTIETRNGQTVDLRGGKEDHYEGGLRTPMIAYWPGTIPAGSTSNELVAFYDFMPTFADLAGATSQLPAGIDGVSLAPTLTGVGTQQQHEGIYFEGYNYNPNSQPTQVGRIGDWKMIRNADGSIQLFNLASDPSETTNRAGDPSVRDIRNQLTSFILRNHTPISSQFNIVPPTVGTGNSKNNGIMSFGNRPENENRAWHVDGNSLAQNFRSTVQNEANSSINVFLDDLQMVYTVDMSLQRLSAQTPDLVVELMGASGFSYFKGTLKSVSLPLGTTQAVQLVLDASAKTPTQSQLTTDLGSSLTLRLSYPTGAGQILASNISLSGIDAVMAAAPIMGDFNSDGLIDAVDWQVFRQNLYADLSSLSAVDAAARGDINGDGRNDELDFTLFKQIYNGLHGPNALALLVTQVPEPEIAPMMILLSMYATVTRRHGLWRS